MRTDHPSPEIGRDGSRWPASPMPLGKMGIEAWRGGKAPCKAHAGAWVGILAVLCLGQASIPPRSHGGTLSCARGALSTCRMGRGEHGWVHCFLALGHLSRSI